VIIVTATLSFETEADRDAAVAATVAIQAATRNDEPGCLAYCFGPDPVEPTHVQVYELWADAASLDAHFAHPNYADMVTALRGTGILRSDNRLWMAEDRGAVYDETGTFRRSAVEG
jgi:quinol monooxygenase YgiN